MTSDQWTMFGPLLLAALAVLCGLARATERREALQKHCVLDIVNKRRAEAVKIAVQHGNRSTWEVVTKAPHAEFDIMEDGEVFCRAAVIDLKELP